MRRLRRVLGEIKYSLSHPREFVEALQCRTAVKNYCLGDEGYKRIYHYHIRKTGGTSLNQMFLALSGQRGEVLYETLGDRVYEEKPVESLNNRPRSPNRPVVVNDKVFVGWNKRLIEQGYYFYAFSHLPAHELKLPDRTFTVTCLREPVSRMVSLYNMLTYYHDNKFPHPGMVEQSRWLGNSFSDFLLRVPRRELFGQLHMFSKTLSLDEALENIIKCSHYFFAEDFLMGVQQLSEKLNLPLQPIHVRKTSQRAPITPAEMERLRSIVEPEVKLYERLRAYSNNTSYENVKYADAIAAAPLLSA